MYRTPSSVASPAKTPRNPQLNGPGCVQTQRRCLPLTGPGSNTERFLVFALIHHTRGRGQMAGL